MNQLKQPAYSFVFGALIPGLVGLTFAIFLEGTGQLVYGAQSANEGIRPNIIVFIADDLGWKDVGFHGSDIRTPTLDRLADAGMQLDAFYAFPWCAATRAAFETGVNPAKFGIRSLEHRYPGGRAIPFSASTVAERLAPLGYKSHMIGKWHLSRTFVGGPLERGYDAAFGFMSGQIDHVEHRDQWGNEILFDDAELVERDGHLTDLIAERAEAIIAREREPYFLNIRFSAPHYPLQAPKEYLQLYRDQPSESRRIFAAMVTHMDAAIGRVVLAVENNGQLENTVFVFFSDNGGQLAWHGENTHKFYNGRFGPYEFMAHNGTLKEDKTTVYEGGIRVPAVVYAPGLGGRGKPSTFTTVLDWLPTFLELAGGEVPADVDGVSLAPLLHTGKQQRIPVFHWIAYSDNVLNGGGKQEALRRGKWKLVTTQQRFWWLPWRLEWPFRKVELYDIEADPEERHDVSSTHESLVEEMRAELTQFQDRYFNSISEESGAP